MGEFTVGHGHFFNASCSSSGHFKPPIREAPSWAVSHESHRQRSVFHRYVYFPYQPFSLRAVEVDRQKSVLQFCANYPHAVCKDETTLELAGGDATVEKFTFRVVALAAAHNQLAFLGGYIQVAFGEACHGKRYPQFFRRPVRAAQTFDIVRRIAVTGFREAFQCLFHCIEAQKKRAGKGRHSSHLIPVLFRATSLGKTLLAFLRLLLIWSAKTANSSDQVSAAQGIEMSDKRRIIIDTDPGQDDAVAILLALGSPELEVVGITAVAGNVPLKLTEKNARKICELAGRPDIKVYAGAIRPLMRNLVTAEEVHGKTGLNGPELPEPKMKLQDEHAVDFIVRTLMEEESGSITLCPLGPLTNIALALIREPKIAPRIKEIVLMGGGFFEGGNVTPAAEFNIYVDPHAADVVLRSGVPIVMMPLDVTHKALTSAKRIAAVRALGNRVGEATAQMLEFFERFDEEKYGTDGGPLHDPCVIAYLLKPGLFKGRSCNVTVETASELTMGMTVIDWWGVTKRQKNALVMRDIDSDGFFALLTERLGRL
jgi:purine nucleosidase